MTHVTREKRIADGLCVNCGLRPHQKERRKCVECAKVEALKRRLRTHAMIQAGKCLRCCKVKPIVAGHRCEECRQKNNAETKRWKDRQ